MKSPKLARDCASEYGFMEIQIPEICQPAKYAWNGSIEKGATQFQTPEIGELHKFSWYGPSDASPNFKGGQSGDSPDLTRDWYTHWTCGSRLRPDKNYTCYPICQIELLRDSVPFAKLIHINFQCILTKSGVVAAGGMNANAIPVAWC